MKSLIAHFRSPLGRLTLALLVCGAIGGALMALTPAPMPWLLGSLMATGLVAALRGRDFPPSYAFPTGLRMVFVAIIGALIGARVDPEMLSRAQEFWISLGTVTVFVILAHAWNYVMFRRVARYDRTTAFFAGTPGGLIESIELGSAAGGDIRLLTLQHYWRIILVILLIPAGLSLLHGHAMGSAGGMTLSDDAQQDLGGIPALLAVAAAGLLAARLFRLPAGPLVGAMLISALASGFGLLQVHAPDWLVNVAQVFIGVSIGARFIGITARMVRLSVGYALLSVAGMLVIGGVLAVLSAPLVGEGIEVMFIAMAPGGAIEMGLVALSLQVNPAFVTFHHLYRIGIAVLDVTFMSRWLGITRPPG